MRSNVTNDDIEILRFECLAIWILRDDGCLLRFLIVIFPDLWHGKINHNSVTRP